MNNKITWKFSINGSDSNPFEEMGLIQNPFPQHGDYQLNGCDLAIQSLGGEPITSESDIRDRLDKHFSEEFIESIVKRYIPGQIVNCEVTCEW